MFLSQNKNTSEADVFWENKEEELGTPILAKTLGQIINIENNTPLWGLFYITKNTVYFQTFESESPMALLLSGIGGRKKAHDVTINIPINTILRFGLVNRKKSLFKLFSRPPLVELVWNDDSKENSFILELAHGSEAFILSMEQIGKST